MAHFENSQWAVTDYGLESVKPGAPYEYSIEANRLLEPRGGNDKLYNWPPHMAGKTWIDIDAFIEAFEKALKMHEGKYKGPVDSDKLAASIEDAYDRVSRRNA